VKGADVDLTELTTDELSARLGCCRAHTSDRRRKFSATARTVMQAVAAETASGRPDRAATAAYAFIRDGLLLACGDVETVERLLDGETGRTLRGLLAGMTPAEARTSESQRARRTRK